MNSPLCPFFLERESIKHALSLCPWVEHVWFGNPLGLRVDKQGVTTLHTWLEIIWRSLPSGSEAMRKTISYIQGRL